MFTLVDEQAEFIIISKAAKVNFHDEDALGLGLFNQVKNQLGLAALYPVHRLDKMTSGLMIMAKTLHAAQTFQQLFSDHAIEKYYVALSDQKPGKKQGLIKGDMAKSRRGTWKLLRSLNNPAISQFFSYTVGDGKRLYVVKPATGKTHQIRVALASIGAAIIGDNRYYGQSDADRGYLHAFALRFEFNNLVYHYCQSPLEGELFFSSECQQLIATITPPWQLSWPKLNR